jgi:hypothetical protein
MKYIVYIGGWEKGIECETRDEVWRIIGDRPWGSTYEVISPTENTDEFIPF